MLSNNAAATAGKGENLLHLERARKKGPFPNFPQRGTPLIPGLLGDDFADWALVKSSPDQFTSNKLPLFVRVVAAARELLAAENEVKLADEAVVAVQDASTQATAADVKDIKDMMGAMSTAFQVGLEQLGSRMDEISGRVDDIAEQTTGLRKSIQQDLVTTGRTIHQHVAKEIHQQLMKEGGYSAQLMKEGGYSAQQLHDGGYSAQQLKEVGYSAEQLKEVGYSAQQLQQGGCPASDIAGLFGLKGQALHDIGYPASALTAYQHPRGWKEGSHLKWYCCQCTNQSSKYCKDK
jgi:hypothetical protein